MSERLTEVDVRGNRYTVQVDTAGTFYAKVEGVQLEAKALDVLIKKIAAATKPELVRVSIPFARWKSSRFGSGIQRGVITGRHAANGNLLVRFDGSKSVEQERWYQYGDDATTRFLRLSSLEEKQYARLVRAALDAQRLREKFEKKHSFDPVAEIEKIVPPEKDEAAP